MAVDKNGQTAPTQAQNPQQTGEAVAAVLQAALRKCHPPAALILGCRSSSSELWEGALIPAVFWRGRGMEQRRGLGPPGPCGTLSPSCAAWLMHLGCRRPLYEAKTPSPLGSSPGSLSWGSGQGAGQSHHPRALVPALPVGTSRAAAPAPIPDAEAPLPSPVPHLRGSINICCHRDLLELPSLHWFHPTR